MMPMMYISSQFKFSTFESRTETPLSGFHSYLLSAFRLGLFLSGTPFQNAQKICLEISPVELEIRFGYTARFVPPIRRLVKLILRKKRTVPNGAKRMFERSQSDARRLRIRPVAAMSISVSEVCTLYS
jgi:hypothetical protein